MILLAVDTCLGACSAAVVADGRVLASLSEPMLRGHQERLAPMVEEAMARAETRFSALGKVAATVGPGSFTGLRVGLAFAKGMAAALDIPCIGVGSLEALAFGVPGRVIACADARHGQVYWQAFDGGAAASEPALGPVGDISWQPDLITGPGAGLLAAAFPGAARDDRTFPDPAAVARIALASDAPAAPIYLRPPDAKLPGGIVPQW